jgi:hypothetical protein
MVIAVLKGPLVGLIVVMVGTGGGGGLAGGVLPFFEQAWAKNNKIPKRTMAIDGFGSRMKQIFVDGNLQSPIYDPESSGVFAYVCETFGEAVDKFAVTAQNSLSLKARATASDLE